MSEQHPLETRYQIALEAGQVGIWTWDRSTGDIVWDASAREIMGLAPDARLGLEKLVAMIHAEERSMVQAALATACDPEGNGLLEFNCRVLPPAEGGERWIKVLGRVEADAAGPVRICGAVRDISELRWAEVQAGRLEAGLWAIVSIAADAIISLDERLRITLFNDGAERMFGYTRDEMIGEPLDALIPARFRPSHAHHVKQFGAGGTVSRRMAERAEIYGQRKDGAEFPAEASISHVEIGGEKIYTVVMRDVSEGKRALDQLALSRAELEQRVAERTAALKAEMQRREETQAQLVRTQRMEAFGQLTGGIAHDFNNLLTVITGNLELLEMRLEDERAKALLKRAHDAAEMGARLTSRLLTFARRRQFAPAMLDLNEQVMGMVDLLRRTLGEHIDLNARLAPRLWRVRSDPSEVENAVLNLAINARDAMPHGGRLIIETANVEAGEGEIGAIGKLAAGAYVRLSVSDTGHGMPPDVLVRAFEPFFTTKQPGKGTGLGLSTIYGFAQQSGGTATIYSEAGIGTTVSLYLPRAADAGAPTLPVQEAEIPPAKGELVLLVEDNAEVREVTGSRLAELGYRVVEAESGPAALAVLGRTPGIDIVFSDIVMAGGMSGFDLAERVAAGWPGVKLLLTSGFADEVLRGRGRPGQNLPILTKPYSRSELARAFRRLLDG
ncbi:MAG: PAS domain S-box protein [Hyphomicrobiaceae bacterium]|nr:PAS domain S-box protein [Hyphomicrobiaceae bacterium]